MSGREENKTDDTIGRLRPFVYLFILILAGVYFPKDHRFAFTRLLMGSAFPVAIWICQWKIRSQDYRSILVAFADLIFVGYSLSLYRDWSLFPLYLMPMSSIRRNSRPWLMGLVAIIGILTEWSLLWETKDALFHLAEHSIFAMIFMAILMTITSIELREEREKAEVTQLLNELRLAHDYLKDNNRNLAYLAQTDALTELYNYRFFEKTIVRYFESAQRFGYSLSLLMIDVDHFKNLNDTFGHRTGDSALKDIARILKENVRKGDFVCRYGGEEFSVILPKTDLNQAKDLAERICFAVRNFKHRGIGSERITVSIGVSTYPGEAKSIQELAEYADQALYEAKHQGRDCVVARRMVYNDIHL